MCISGIMRIAFSGQIYTLYLEYGILAENRASRPVRVYKIEFVYTIVLFGFVNGNKQSYKCELRPATPGRATDNQMFHTNSILLIISYLYGFICNITLVKYTWPESKNTATSRFEAAKNT